VSTPVVVFLLVFMRLSSSISSNALPVLLLIRFPLGRTAELLWYSLRTFLRRYSHLRGGDRAHARTHEGGPELELSWYRQGKAPRLSGADHDGSQPRLLSRLEPPATWDKKTLRWC